MDRNILIALIGTIMIPVIVAIENWMFRNRKDRRDINRIIYIDKFNYSYDELFSHELRKNVDSEGNENDLGDFNIELIRKFIRELNNFHELGNKFKGIRVQRKFTKLLKIANKLLKKEKEHKWFKYTDFGENEGAINYFNDFKHDLFNLKIKFIEFYKSIYDAI